MRERYVGGDGFELCQALGVHWRGNRVHGRIADLAMGLQVLCKGEVGKRDRLRQARLEQEAEEAERRERALLAEDGAGVGQSQSSISSRLQRPSAGQPGMFSMLRGNAPLETMGLSDDIATPDLDPLTRLGRRAVEREARMERARVEASEHMAAQEAQM